MVAIDSSGLTEVIGQYCASLKIGQGRPYVLALLICFAAWLMGSLVSAVAARRSISAGFRRYGEKSDPADRSRPAETGTQGLGRLSEKAGLYS